MTYLCKDCAKQETCNSRKGPHKRCFVPLALTNADRIRAMSDEELAWELMLWRCEAVARHHGIESEYPDTQQTILKWLRQPAEEDT